MLTHAILSNDTNMRQQAMLKQPRSRYVAQWSNTFLASAKALGTLKGSRCYRVMLVTTPLKKKDIFTHSFDTSAYACAPQVCRWPQETERTPDPLES